MVFKGKKQTKKRLEVLHDKESYGIITNAY